MGGEGDGLLLRTSSTRLQAQSLGTETTGGQIQVRVTSFLFYILGGGGGGRGYQDGPPATGIRSSFGSQL